MIEGTPHMPRKVVIVPLEVVFLGEMLEPEMGLLLNSGDGDESGIVDLSELSTPDLVSQTRDVLLKPGGDEVRSSMKRRILTALARDFECSKVMLPGTSSEFAAKLLESVATGRGSGISFQCNYLDTRSTEVTFINCMREFTQKECVYYLRGRGVPLLTLPQPQQKQSATISQLAESFITGFQSEFPSTVSTVLRTAAKLEGVQLGQNCRACVLPCPVGEIYCHGCEIVLGDSDVLPFL